MSEEEKIAPFTEFYKQVVFAEKAFDVNYKEVAKVVFNEVDRLNNIIDKAIEYIKHSQSYGTMAQVMPHLKPYVNGDDLLEILGDKE